MKPVSTVYAIGKYPDRKTTEGTAIEYTSTVLVLENETYPNDLAFKLTILYNVYGLTANSLPEKNKIFAKEGLPELNEYDFGDGDETEYFSVSFYVGNTTTFAAESAIELTRVDAEDLSEIDPKYGVPKSKLSLGVAPDWDDLIG